nr:ribonuclease P protein component [uncultured Campylobacter sp.]
MGSQKEFSCIYKDAAKWHSENLIVFFKESSENKLAVVASKKVGNAVIRNRCKRLLRAIFVEIGDELKSGVYIVIVKYGLEKSPYLKIKKNVCWALKKLGCVK